MRCAWLVLAGAVLASGLASGYAVQRPAQVVMQMGEAPDDFVDVLLREADARGVALDADAQPVAPWSSSLKWDMTSCDIARPAIEIEHVALMPDPPQKGQRLAVHGTGTVTSEITVFMGILKVHSERVDLCAALAENDVEIQCPLAPGHYDVTHVVDIPARIPPGTPASYAAHLRIQVTGETQAHEPLPCLIINVSSLPFLSRATAAMRAQAARIAAWLSA